MHKALSFKGKERKRERERERKTSGKKGKNERTFKFRSNFAHLQPYRTGWTLLSALLCSALLFSEASALHARIICANPERELNRTLYYNYILYRCYLPRAKSRFTSLEREQKGAATVHQLDPLRDLFLQGRFYRDSSLFVSPRSPLSRFFIHSIF